MREGSARLLALDHLGDSAELLASQFVAAPLRAGRPAVHQIEQVATTLATVRVALPLLRRIRCVGGDLPFAGVIAFTTKRTVDSLVHSGARDFECMLAANCSCTGERLLCHPLVDVEPVVRFGHGNGIENDAVPLTALTENFSSMPTV